MEQWKDIKGFEGLYQVSNLGKVKSLKRYVNHIGNSKRIIKECILTNRLAVAGYHFITLHKNKRYNKTIHRLVALAFIPNPLNKPCINHINGIKTDNRIDNLEWVTHKENTAHAWKLGLSKSVTKQVLMSTLDDNPLIIFESLIEAQRQTGIDDSHISHCCNGKRKTTGGYKWRFV